MILPPVDPPHARAALRVEVARAQPGKPFLAAVEIRTDPHWHVYWRNPGDSGVPTRIAWQAPKGWTIEPLEFPVPKRFAPGGITAYGYEGKTLFLARVTPSKAPGALTAKATWLVCSEACVQGSATLSVRVPVGAVKQTPQAATLRAAAKALPTPLVGRAFVKTGPSVNLTVAFPPFTVGRDWWKTAEFFPAVSGVVDQGVPLLATLQGTELVFKMKPSPFPEARTRLPGLIVFASGAKRQVLSVNPTLEKETRP